MSAILSQITPWIAASVFESMMFDPDQNPKMNRKTRIVQVFSPPQTIELSPKHPHRSYDQFIISDGRNHISVYIPKDNTNTCVIQGELERIRKGSLVRFKHLQISTHTLLGVDTKQNLNKPMCLVVDPVKMNSECILYQDEAKITDVSLEGMGCENAGIIGNPIDVHDDIDVRRALIAFQYNHRLISKQVIDCFNYIVRGHSFEKHGGKLLPGWSQFEIGTFDSEESMKQVSLIVEHNLKQNKLDDEHDAHENEDESGVNGLEDEEENANSTMNDDKQEKVDEVDDLRYHTLTQNIASIGQVLLGSDSEDSDNDDDSERIETQNPDMHRQRQDEFSNTDEMHSNLDLDDKIRNDKSKHSSNKSVDVDNLSESDGTSLEDNLNPYSAFLETQDALKVMESNIYDVDNSSDLEKLNGEDHNEIKVGVLKRDRNKHRKHFVTQEMEGDDILETQPASFTMKEGIHDEDFYSAQSQVSRNSREESEECHLGNQKTHGKQNHHTVASSSQRNRVNSVSAWLKYKSSDDSSQNSSTEQSDKQKSKPEKQHAASLKPSEQGTTTKKRVFSTSAWMKRKDDHRSEQSQNSYINSTKKRKLFSVIRWMSNGNTDE